MTKLIILFVTCHNKKGVESKDLFSVLDNIMSLTFDPINEFSNPIALKKMASLKRQKENEILFLTEHQDGDVNDGLTEKDITDDMLISMFGKQSMRSMKRRAEKRKELMADIKGGYITQNLNNVVLKDNASFETLPYSLGYEKDDAVTRDVFLLFGKSGAGKTYYSRQLIDKYRKAGYNKLYVFSQVKTSKYGKVRFLNINDFVSIDGNAEEMAREYEKAKIRYKFKKKEWKDEPEKLMKLEMQLIDLKPNKDIKKKLELRQGEDETNDFFTDSVVVFDDYENESDVKKIQFLRDLLLTTGRHRRCNMVICNHSANEGHSMRIMKAETDNYVFFQKGDDYERNYTLDRRLNFDRQLKQRISLALESSRWVNINVDSKYILSQKQAFLY